VQAPHEVDLSLQEASSTFNCAAYATQAAGSLNRRWRIVRPYGLYVVCLRHERLGVGLEGDHFFISCRSQLFEYQDSD
jgi:hypothetical protein